MTQELISAKQFYKRYSKEEFEEYYFNHTKAELLEQINAHPTHGGHPFDSASEADQKQLEYWKTIQEEHPVYKSPIDAWTYRDPLKMKTAKDNNLNYLCLYDKQQIRNFANGLAELLKFIKAKGRLIS